MLNLPVTDRTALLQTAIAPDPLQVAPHTPLQEVLEQMSRVSGKGPEPPEGESQTGGAEGGESKHSYVLVVEAGQLQGILTERDVVRLTAAGKSPSGQTIGEVMTRDLITLPLSQFHDAFVPLQLFQQHRIRHLPVVDDQGSVVGVITAERLRQLLQPADLLKLRRIADVMSAEVVTAPPEATVLQVAHQMVNHRVSCVVIASREGAQANWVHPVGIVTERDMVKFQAMELSLEAVIVAQVMSKPLVCLHPEDSLWQAHQTMQNRGLRRIVVTGDHHELVGILTQTSLLRILDPMEMYSVLEVLQQRVAELETERTELLRHRAAQLEQEVQIELAERKQAEQHIRFQASLLDAVEQAVIAADLDGRITYWNRYAEILYGWDVEEVVGKSIFDILPAPIFRAQARDILLRSGEFLARHRSGRLFPAMLTNSPLYDATGEMIGIVGISVDISDRKAVEVSLQRLNEQLEQRVQERTAALQKTNQKLHQEFAERHKMVALVEHSLDMIAMATVDRRITYLNRAGRRLLGLDDATDVTALTIEDFHFPADWPELEAKVIEVLRQGQPWQGEVRLRHFQTGAIIPMQHSAFPIKDAQTGDVVAFAGILHDLTARYRTEQALRDSEARFRAVFEQAAVSINLVDADGCFIKVNQRFCEFLGYPEAEILGQPFDAFSYPEDLGRDRACWERLLAGEIPTYSIEKRYITRSGELRWGNLTVSLIHSSGKSSDDGSHGHKTLYGIGILEDIQERKQVEEALWEGRERERLLGAIAQRIRESLELDEILATTVESVQQVLGADRVLVYHLLPDGSGSVIAEALATDQPALLSITLPSEVFPPECYLPYIQGRTCALADRDQGGILPCLVQFMEQFDIRAKLVVPLILPGNRYQHSPKQLWGLLIAHQCQQPRQWQDWEIDLLQQLSDQLAIAIQQSVLYARLQVQLEEREWALQEQHRVEEQLKASLEEKDLLLKEVHHRVKNNLQVISSIFSLQASYLQEPKILAVLEESQDRIRSMALIHEKLYQSDRLTRIDFADYIQTLVDNLFASYSISPNRVKLHLRVSETHLSLDTAIPCGLIINELVSNSLKHAFPACSMANKSCEIHIQFTTRDVSSAVGVGPERWDLIIRDNGVGLPANLSLPYLESLGLSLVRALTFQLKGTLDMYTDGGAVFHVSFPKPREHRRF
jgi:PAS domain S-box-containing protein